MIKNLVECKLRADYLISNGLNKEVLAERYQIQKESVGVWLRQSQMPPISVLLDMAKELNTNVSFLLSLTEYSFPLDSYEPDMRLNEIRKERKMHLVELAEQSGASITTVRKYGDGEIDKPNLKVILTFSTLLGVSMEYMMGLTRFKTWEDAAISYNPFILLEKGKAICIIDSNGDKKFYLVTEDMTLINSDGEIFTQADLKSDGIEVVVWDI